ncbi:unnamed protein product, partial [Rotaria sp. Silwood2]
MYLPSEKVPLNILCYNVEGWATRHLEVVDLVYKVEIEITVIVDVFNLSDPIRIIGIYWPQGQERNLDDLSPYITQETIITGDFNASLAEWNSTASDKR